MNADPTTSTAAPLTDVNVWLSRWPFRRLQFDETAALVSKLRSLGITQAWAGSFDAVLHRDIAGVNARLAEDCRRHSDGMLIAFGTINPMLPDWEEDIRRCHETHKVPGVRLLPNYHGYKLDDPLFGRLLEMCEKRKLVVQISVSMEDERTQHPLVRVPVVDLAPLPDALEKTASLNVVLLNALRTARGGEPLTLLAKCPRLFLDIATLEGVGGVGNVIEKYSADRLLFGTYAPFYYPEAATLKLKESAVAGAALRSIAVENARRICTL